MLLKKYKINGEVWVCDSQLENTILKRHYNIQKHICSVCCLNDECTIMDLCYSHEYDTSNYSYILSGYVSKERENFKKSKFVFRKNI